MCISEKLCAGLLIDQGGLLRAEIVFRVNLLIHEGEELVELHAVRYLERGPQVAQEPCELHW